MDTLPPTITVVVSVLNGARTLQRCLESVVSQSYQPWELIVIDGGSSDGSVEILKEYDDRIHYWESRPDKGIYSAWNKAIARATGDWIYFLGADDFFWQVDVLGKVSNYLSARQERVVYGGIRLVTAEGETLRQMGDPWTVASVRFRRQMSIPHQAVFHHKRLFVDHGYFDESFRIAADYEFLCRELKSAPAFFMPDVVVAGVQAGGASGRVRSALRISIERARVHRRHYGNFTAWPAIQLVKSLTHEMLRALVGARKARQVINLYRRARGKSRV